MHDPGDEHPGGDTVAGIVGWAFACPFCDCRIGYGNHCRTPLRIHLPLVFPDSTIQMIPEPMDRSYELLDTCDKPGCVEQARKFVKQHNLGGGQKQHAVFKRWHYPKEYR